MTLPLRHRVAAAIAIAAAAALIGPGCGGYQSSYRRTSSTPSELVWAYRDKFLVTQDGKIVAEERDWDGLTGVVACVPRARDWADTAASRDRSGAVLGWTGVGIMLAGIAAGATLLLQDTSNTDQILLGGGVMIGGVAVGTPFALTGVVRRAQAQATAIDAVNVYNDERAVCTSHR
jgi:hypothetical protein